MNSPLLDRGQLALLTDLYELTMMQAYFDQQMRGEAVFDLFVRRLPRDRRYLLVAGLDEALRALEDLRFDQESIAYLRSLNRFSGAFLGSLETFRFTGDVRAMPEGSIAFADEPLLEVIAPLPEAQLVETLLINQIQLQTMAASKAARVVHASQGKRVVDFGLRKAHGADAGLRNARAFFIAGVESTSNVLAGKTYGIPVSGTMAHSYIQACGSELEAFRTFVASFPATALLVDTYDTLEGVRNVVKLARELGEDFKVVGIRLDSGDIGPLARTSRQMLDEAGLTSVQIFASNSMDEHTMQDLLNGGAPIDGFGVGSRMAVSEDCPYLDMVYKLVEYDGRPTMKRSVEKATLPGRKQVFRRVEGAKAVGDVIALADESCEGQPMLQRVMHNGRRTGPSPSLEEIRASAARNLVEFPADLRLLEPGPSAYPVQYSPGLLDTREKLSHFPES